MPAQLASHTYGKSNVRLVKVTRRAERHNLLDVSVDVALEGDFQQTFLSGDNRDVLPTDTIKNSVYALAKQHDFVSIEEFGLLLSAHFLDRLAHAERAEITLRERPWQRITVDGDDHTHAFCGTSREQQTATVTRTRAGATVTAGVAHLPILKTTGSAFRGFLRDEWTTLPEADDRLFGTNLTARWTYQSGAADLDFNGCHALLRQTLLDIFAKHDASQSVQQTLFLMGQAALDTCPEVDDIALSMPNEHRLLVDLAPFGLENPNEIFVPVDEPSGMIEARLVRG